MPQPKVGFNLSQFLNQKSLAFASTSFGASLIGAIFGLYRIDLFTSVYKLDASYFYTCQVVYAVWNAVNDPLFGWIIDHSGSGSAKRLPAIKYGGPLWTIAFLLPWWPWGDSTTDMTILAVQFCFCLCAYDTFLTYVLLVHCALIADMTTNNHERNNLNLMRTFAGITGSGISSVSYLFWNKEDLSNFRMFCIMIAFIASCAFWYTGTHLKLERMDRQHIADVKKKEKHGNKSEMTMWQFFLQLAPHWNFWMYVAMNFLQNLHNTFSSGYWLFFVDKVVEPIFPPLARKLFVFVSLYGTHCVIPILTPFANQYGKHAVIQFCTTAKLIVGLSMTLVGVNSWYIWMPLFLLNHLLLQSSGFYDVIIADVIDEDMVRNRRTQSMSTSVHGVQALFVKPAQSIAPMIGVYILSEYAMNHTTAELERHGELQRVQRVTYNLFALVTWVVAALQLIVWRQYGLRGQRLQSLKKRLNFLENDLQCTA